jgi:hypothetical protein
LAGERAWGATRPGLWSRRREMKHGPASISTGGSQK